MKKLYFSVPLFFISHILIAQTYTSIDEFDATWDFMDISTSGTDVVYGPVQYITESDTFFNDNTYKKVYRSYSVINRELIGFIREDSLKKVYYNPIEPFCPNDTISEYLLYDFSLQVGDSLKITMPDILSNPCIVAPINIASEVIAIDSVLLTNGEYRKRFLLGEDWGLNTHYHIEGIGSTIDLIYIFNYATLDGWHIRHDLICFLIQNSILHLSPNWQEAACFLDPSTNINEVYKEEQFEVYPNPGTNIITIKSDTEANELLILELIDVNGKVLIKEEIFSNQQIDIASLQNGIYYIKIANRNKINVLKFVK
jgi:Secretion system C-terminal sorting domain